MHKDPAELRNVESEDARRAAALDRELDTILADSKRRALAPQSSPMDRETEESLRALGYLAPPSTRQSLHGMDPKDGIVIYNKLEEARHLAQSSKWTQSEAMLKEILAVLPENVSAQNILALVHLRQDQYEQARQDYLKSLALDPKQARVYGILGTISLLEGKFDQAEREYKQGLEISPDFIESMANLGLLEVLRHHPAGAKVW